MGDYNAGKELLERKVHDYEAHSSLMPIKAKVLSKLFAGSLGRSAGRVLSAYEQIITLAGQGHDLTEISHQAERYLQRESKVKFKLFGKEGQGRICGLVALNESGYVEAESELYLELVTDIQSLVENSYSIYKSITAVVTANPEKYKRIMELKEQSIYDFGVLMGITDDSERLQELTSSMPSGYANYFNKITKLHNGRFGLSWPLPFKKFTLSMMDALHMDSISTTTQESLNVDYGYSIPTSVDLNETAELLKANKDIFASGDLGFGTKLKFASQLPTNSMFLIGMGSFLKEGEDSGIDSGTVTTIAATAYSLADDIDDFITTMALLWTTFV